MTCVAGNVDARQVAMNTRAVLELAGRTDVEVALGREMPLVRPLETTPETHGPQGLGYAELPPPSRPLSDRHAVDLIVDEARRRPGEITLVTLGPLTNLALAVARARPAAPAPGLVLMGGAYGVSGNTAPTTEWNVPCDPDAAKIVFRAGPRRSPPTRRSRARSRSASTSPSGRRSCRTTWSGSHAARAARRTTRSRSRGRGPDARDPLRGDQLDRALRRRRAAVLHGVPRAATTASTARSSTTLWPWRPPSTARSSRPRRSRRRRAGRRADRGETVTDRRRLAGKPPNLDVAVEADVATFLDRFIERVGGLAAERSGVAR